jgi:hypothetical protein
METFSRDEDDQQKESRLNLITHVAVEKASEQDVDALMPAIEASEKRGIKPKTVLADTAYGSDENAQKAEGADVELVAPVKDGYNGKPGTAMKVCDFAFGDNGRIVNCPAGHSPENVRYKKKTKRFTARFDLERCRTCPKVDDCPIKPGKKYYYLWYSEKDYRVARRRQFEASDEFTDIYRWRAGVEATMSQYDRLTGVKRLRVRGFGAVRFCAIMKAAGINIIRAAAVRITQRKNRRPAMGLFLSDLMPFSFFKERIGRCWSSILKIYELNFVCTYSEIKSAL